MPQVTIQQAMEEALARHRAGDLQQAATIYQQILTLQPGNSDALHLLGVVQCQAGKMQQGVELIRRALAIHPRTAAYHASLGKALALLGQHDDAIAAYRASLALEPDQPNCLNELGIELLATKQPEQAGTVFRQALLTHPDFPEFHYNLGNALRDAGRIDEAITAFREAVRIRPDMHPAYENLGNALQNKGDFEEAIAAYRQALTINPDRAELHYDIGRVLQKMDRLDEAAAAYQQALRLRPEYASATNNLGSVLLSNGRWDEAIDAFRRAAGLYSKPDSDGALAHCNLGMALLLRGDFANGWPEYEWRTRTPDARDYCRDYPQPRWDGSPLNGRTILLHAEQGAGDTIQFARYAPLVKVRGGNVILQCQPELVRLLRSMRPEFQVVSFGEALPAFDVHCPLLSLPGVLGTTLQTIPANVPYVYADPESSSRWRQRLPTDQFKVGIAWAGRRTHENDRNRSLSLEAFSPLAQVQGIRLYSLQKSTSGVRKIENGETRSAHLAFPLTDWTDEFGDFADTACVIDSLDLVITVDTSVAHLAGALGQQVWVLLPFNPDWRWMLQRLDSPWYPTIRLFRQPRIGDWCTPIGNIADALTKMIMGPTAA